MARVLGRIGRGVPSRCDDRPMRAAIVFCFLQQKRDSARGQVNPREAHLLSPAMGGEDNSARAAIRRPELPRGLADRIQLPLRVGCEWGCAAAIDRGPPEHASTDKIN